MEKFLKDEEIIEAVKNYLDNSIYNYAIMIDGDWGCGKTFFVKEKLIPAITEYEKSKEALTYKSKKVIYISLYGVKTTGDISKMIYVNARNFSEKFSIKNAQKMSAYLGTSVKVISDVIQHFTGADTEQTVMELLETLEMKDYIIILDDLERCNCNVNTLLGYINNFVEHDGTKVILVANEKEVGKEDAYNEELRFLVCSNPNIDFKQLDEEKLSISSVESYKHDNSKADEKVDVERLRKRSNVLFEDGELYFRIKEKLIGLTIRYFPDFYGIMYELTNIHIEDEKLKNIVLGRIEKIVDWSQYNEHYNLRTYQFFLSKIKRIGEVLKGEEYKNVLTELVEYVYAVCALYKKGEYDFQWESGSIYQSMPLYGEWNFGGYRIGFRFVDEFILYEKFEKEQIISHVNHYLQKQCEMAERPDDPLKEFEGWWEKSEEEVRNAWINLQKNIEENKYSLNLYPKIVSTMARLVSIGFEEELLDVAVTGMKKNILEFSGQIFFDMHDAMFLDQQSRKIYNRAMEELSILAKQKNDEEKEDYFETMLKDEKNWGHNLYSFIEESRSLSLEEKSFISKLDISTLIQTIEASDNSNMSAFRFAMAKVYNFSNIADFYRQDYQFLKLLNDGLNEDNEGYDILKKMNIRLLKNLLEEKMELLSPSSGEQ